MIELRTYHNVPARDESYNISKISMELNYDRILTQLPDKYEEYWIQIHANKYVKD